MQQGTVGAMEELLQLSLSSENSGEGSSVCSKIGVPIWRNQDPQQGFQQGVFKATSTGSLPRLDLQGNSYSINTFREIFLNINTFLLTITLLNL